MKRASRIFIIVLALFKFYFRELAAGFTFLIRHHPLM
jgi:hypothetical protein